MKATEEGQVVDVLCYNISMATHEKLAKMRKNVYVGEFVDYLKQNEIIYAGAHFPEAVGTKDKDYANGFDELD